MSVEKKVGLFFIVGLFLLLIFTMTVEDIKIPFLSKELILVTSFSSIGDLRTGNTVTLMGMPVGRVKKFELKGREIYVYFYIDKNIKIPKDSTVEILMSSMLGGNYLNIKLGKSSDFLKSGDYIKGTEINSISHLVDDVKNTTKKIQSFMDNLNKNQKDFFANLNDLIKKNKSKFNRIIDNFDKSSQNVKITFANLRNITDQIKKGNGTIGKLVWDDSPYNNLKEITSNLKEVSKKLKSDKTILGKLINSEKMGSEFENTFTNFQEVSKNLKDITAKKDEVEKLIKNLSEASKTLKTISNKLVKVSDNLAKGKGTLGKLVNDDDLYKQLKDLLTQANEAIKNIEETMVNNAVLSTFITGVK